MPYNKKYLEVRKVKYKNNVNGEKDKSLTRAKKYYYEVLVPKRKANISFYKEKDRLRNQIRLKKRKIFLRQLREKHGGKCSMCDYDKNIDILQFHHQKNKVENVTSIPSLRKMELEAEKCILLCPNCHALTHQTYD